MLEVDLGVSDDLTMPGLPGSNVAKGARRLDKAVADEIKLIGDTLKEQVPVLLTFVSLNFYVNYIELLNFYVNYIEVVRFAALTFVYMLYIVGGGGADRTRRTAQEQRRRAGS